MLREIHLPELKIPPITVPLLLHRFWLPMRTLIGSELKRERRQSFSIRGNRLRRVIHVLFRVVIIPFGVRRKAGHRGWKYTMRRRNTLAF